MLQPVFFTQSPGQSCLAGRVRLRARKFGRSDLEAVGAVTFFKPFFRSLLHSSYQALVPSMMMLPYMICLFSRPLLVGTKIKTGQKKTSRRYHTFIKNFMTQQLMSARSRCLFCYSNGEGLLRKKTPSIIFLSGLSFYLFLLWSLLLFVPCRY